MSSPRAKLAPVAEGETCFECGAQAQHRGHVIPHVMGGTATVPLCHACHGLAHGLNFTDHDTLCRLGRERAREEGVHIGGAPFGWSHDRLGVLVHNVGEQATIARAVTLRCAGRTFAQVAATLNVEGHPPRRALAWTAATVRIALYTPGQRAKARSYERRATGVERPAGRPTWLVCPPFGYRPSASAPWVEAQPAEQRALACSVYLRDMGVSWAGVARVLREVCPARNGIPWYADTAGGLLSARAVEARARIVAYLADPTSAQPD